MYLALILYLCYNSACDYFSGIHALAIDRCTYLYYKTFVKHKKYCYTDVPYKTCLSFPFLTLSSSEPLFSLICVVVSSVWHSLGFPYWLCNDKSHFSRCHTFQHCSTRLIEQMC